MATATSAPTSGLPVRLEDGWWWNAVAWRELDGDGHLVGIVLEYRPDDDPLEGFTVQPRCTPAEARAMGQRLLELADRCDRDA